MSPNQGFDVGKLLSGLMGDKQGQSGGQQGQSGQSGLAGMLGGLMGKGGSGGAGGSAIAKLMPAITALVAGGGLQKMMSKLQQGGLEGQARSWVDADTANQPVSAEQITQALGPETVQQVARSSGVSEDQAAQAMASTLPSMVNAVTPDGEVPQHVDMPDTQTMHSQINAFFGQDASQSASADAGTAGTEGTRTS